MTTASVYLTFDGNCQEAFNFYKSVFETDISVMSKFSEMPPQEGMAPIPEEQSNRIMHITLPLGGQSVIHGSDRIDGWGPPYQVGNNFSISVHPDSKSEADRIFTALSEGGNVTMPMTDTFWGSYFGTVSDAYGVHWMINLNTQ